MDLGDRKQILPNRPPRLMACSRGCRHSCCGSFIWSLFESMASFMTSEIVELFIQNSPPALSVFLMTDLLRHAPGTDQLSPPSWLPLCCFWLCFLWLIFLPFICIQMLFYDVFIPLLLFDALGFHVVWQKGRISTCEWIHFFPESLHPGVTLLSPNTSKKYQMMKTSLHTVCRKSGRQ